MNNEPVAWFEQDPDMKSIWYQADQDSPNAIPLYAHPVKELTDDEILQVYSESEIWVPDRDESDLIEFARAILRKAQESCNGFCGEYECKENQSNCKRKAQKK